VIEAQLDGTNTIEIWGDGEQTRSFTYIDDHDRRPLPDHGEQFHPIRSTSGSSQLVTINQLVGHGRGHRRREARAELQPERAAGRPRPETADNTLIRKQLGWEPSVSLEDGTREDLRVGFTSRLQSGREGRSGVWRFQGA